MNTFSDVVGLVAGFINQLVPLLFGLILLVILWRVIDAWIIHAGDGKKLEDGKNTIIVGIIALVVLSGVWGIVALLQRSLFGG